MFMPWERWLSSLGTEAGKSYIIFRESEESFHVEHAQWYHNVNNGVDGKQSRFFIKQVNIINVHDMFVAIIREKDSDHV